MLTLPTGGWSSTDIGTLLSDNGAGFAAGSLLGLDTSAANLNYSSVISGSLGLTKLGTGTLTLSTSIRIPALRESQAAA